MACIGPGGNLTLFLTALTLTTFSGATSNSLDVPSGYAHQIDGQTFLDEPVHSQSSSWGRIKAIYR